MLAPKHTLDGFIPVIVKGHCKITDDLGNVLLDKDNAIHPQNMARIFARALSNEHNTYINRVAFGNGGTIVDAANTVTYRAPNDGQTPDTAGWESRLYFETFSKIINEGQVTLNPLLGVDPGSADINTGVRSGGGSVPSSDPVSIPHVSGPGVRSTDLGLTSEVVITVTLNGDEPNSQYLTDSLPPTSNTEDTFVFDEIGLYTGGATAIDTSGYQYINVGNRTSVDDTGFVKNTTYSFIIAVDGGTPTVITFTTPSIGGSGANGELLYGDFCEAINTGSTSWGLFGSNPLPGGAKVSITDHTASIFPSIAGAETFGFLKFTSNTSGATSTVLLEDVSFATHETVTSLLPNINVPLGGTLEAAVAGTASGLQNAPTNPTTERERLLAHLIFSPILKSANRTLNIVYTLTVSVARTPG